MVCSDCWYRFHESARHPHQRELSKCSSSYYIVINDKRIEQLQTEGKTVVFTVLNGTVPGAIALADIIRSESKQTIAVLKEMNIRCMMLTGDNKQVAKWVSEQVGQRNLLISKLFRVFLSMIFGVTRLDGWMHLIWNLTAETRFLSKIVQNISVLL